MSFVYLSYNYYLFTRLVVDFSGAISAILTTKYRVFIHQCPNAKQPDMNESLSGNCVYAMLSSLFHVRWPIRARLKNCVYALLSSLFHGLIIVYWDSGECSLLLFYPDIHSQQQMDWTNLIQAFIPNIRWIELIWSRYSFPTADGLN